MLIGALVAVVMSGGACWAPPVNAPITDPYRAPPCTYCPGNRGIEFGPRPGQAVSAVQAGVVTFAGTVAGTRYVVVDHADGLRATYGRLATVTVHRGDRVQAGDQVGTTSDGFYFGLRRGVSPNDHPVDPTPMLGVRTYPPRLIPVDGTPAPSPGRGRLTCGNTAGGRYHRSSVRRLARPSRFIGTLLKSHRPLSGRPAHMRGCTGRCAANRTRSTQWPSSPCDRCWKQVFTSDTRPDVGTPR